MSYFPADTFPGIARGVTAYAENETWRITITADNSNISGDGSLEHPYEITTAEELLAVMAAHRTNNYASISYPSSTSEAVLTTSPDSRQNAILLSQRRLSQIPRLLLSTEKRLRTQN